MILAGDIGGTNTRLALFERGAIVREQKFLSKEFQGLEKIVKEFLGEETVYKACFGIAGTVNGGICKATNLPWIVDIEKISKELGIHEVHLLNDLEANAYGIKQLRKEELFVLQEGKKHEGNRALIAAGTGLGETLLFWSGERYRPFASEGGHSDFAPRDDLEIELLRYLKKRYEHVSYERVVSGPGLYVLFQFLTETGKEKLTDQVKKELECDDKPRVISKWGSSRKDPACTKAVDWFISLYGAEAGNLALKFLSLGGLYIGGGIAPHLAHAMKKGDFCHAFCNKGRFKELLKTVPIWIIMNDQTALLGAARYAEEH